MSKYEPGQVRGILQEINEELQPLVELVFFPDQNSHGINTMSGGLMIKINGTYYCETGCMDSHYVVETAKTIQKLYRGLRSYMGPANKDPKQIKNVMYYRDGVRHHACTDGYEVAKVYSSGVPTPEKDGLYMFTKKDYQLYFLPL